MNPLDIQNKALALKREFVTMQQRQAKEVDEAETAISKRHTSEMFRLLAQQPIEVRKAAALQDVYESWEFAYSEDGKELPLHQVQSVEEAEAQALQAGIIVVPAGTPLRQGQPEYDPKNARQQVKPRRRG